MLRLIVVDRAKDWPLTGLPDAQVVSAKSYVSQPSFSELKQARVYNLCSSYRYQSIGYYVSLLATARGHRPMPSITTMQDIKSQSLTRIVSEDLDEVIGSSLSQIKSPDFTLSIYFGRNLAKRHDRLSSQLFNYFQAPLLRAEFHRGSEGWLLDHIRPIPAGEIPPEHYEFVLSAANEFFSRRKQAPRKRTPARFDMAILYNRDDPTAPSDPPALKKFLRAAQDVGFSTEVIDRGDFARIPEFDALFIRETTAVNHFTYRFARRAAAQGLVVIDDPESIVRCTNKVYLAELLARHEIPAPKTVLVHKGNVNSVGEELGFPVVLKKPDSSSSLGVIKARDPAEFAEQVRVLLSRSELVVAQQFLPTDYDWRIGVFNRKPLFACKYFMAHRHWQITHWRGEGRSTRHGKTEAIAVEDAPKRVISTAVRAANLIGDGLYGVDVKQVGRQLYVMEVNDNPNVQTTVEDGVLRDDLYREIMRGFLTRVEVRKEKRLLR